MTHVVVLDNDEETRATLGEVLKQHAFRVTSISENRQLRLVLSQEIVDAFLIEVSYDDGFGIVRSVAKLTDAPILITSGERTTEDDKVEGLEAGASDYICKPYGNRELVARLKAAIRDRTAPKLERIRRSYTFSGNELLVHQRVIRRHDREDVKLTTAEFNLLSAFLGAPREVLSRERLLAASRMHSGEIVDRSLDSLVLRLRRRIEDDPVKPELIRTARGVGYRFDSDVAYEERPRLKR
ncbi:winged helix-turn-helix domain-containing protein [Pararhizobium sp.]|uniref:winged helix-turn-helix domain-containing protein n=1 Tax=Pararhizobium sp. TaxID=1977563 RepID=UPI003D0BE639